MSKIKPGIGADTAKNKEEDKADEQTTQDSMKLIQEKSADKIVLMKKGDYSIHVLIGEIKNCIQIEEDYLPIPIVKVTCFKDQVQRTVKPPQNCTDFTYNEHFYFEETNLAVEELDSSKIVIEAYDSNNSKKRKDYFGIYEMDLEYIYNQPKHSLQNIWVALANPESDDITKVRAYLKLSVSVLHDNDPRVELELSSNDYKCILPSQVEQKYKQIRIYIFKAEGIPDMDATTTERKVNRRCQGYIEINYLGVTRKTQVVEMKNDTIYWNEFIDIPVSIPCVSHRIVMHIKDRDVADIINGDDDIGSIEIDVNDVLDGKYSKGLEYLNIYGSPLNKTGNNYKKMNENSEIGSRWKGQILMKIDCFDIDTPQSKIGPITDQNLIKQTMNVPKANLWTVYIKLYSAIYLPEDKGKYSVRIEMQDKQCPFQQQSAYNGNIDWNVCKKLQVNSLTENVEELPDLFIYLLDEDGNKICFQRIKPLDFYLNSQIMIIKLIPDPCIDKVKLLVQSGLIKIKLSVINQEKDKGRDLAYLDKFKDGDSNVEEEDIEDLENEINQKQYQNKKPYTIVSIVYMSKGLMAQDSNSQNDPYVVLKCIDIEQSTDIKYKTVNGIWNSKLIFNSVLLDINKKSTWPILLCKVNDSDGILGKDLLGYCYLWLCDAKYRINSIETIKPRWHQLYLPKSNLPKGELLLSFYIFDNEHVNLIDNIDPVPKTVPYTFELNILGLRDLKPLSIIPVKKAYINFDMNSLNVTGNKEDNLLPVKTEPKDSGANPTLNSVIKFDIKLPQEEMFMPELQCEVHDHLLKGLSNPLLGVFLLDIKRLIAQTHRQIDEDLELTSEKITAYLSKSLINKFTGNREDQKEEEKDANIKEDYSTNKKLLDGEKNIEMENLPKFKARKKRKILKTFVSDEDLEKNLYNPDLFVLLPEFKNFNLPNNKSSQNEFIVEDMDKAYDKDGNYFAVGHLKKILYDLLDENVKENKDYSKIQDINRVETIFKHYRRIFNKPLEQIRELHLRSPFTKADISRGKDQDVKDENAIFEAISKKENKIIKKYSVDERTGDLKVENDSKIVTKLKGARRKNRANKISNNNYGVFKGVIRICEKNKMNEYLKTIQKFKDENPAVLSQFKNLNKYESLAKSILVKEPVIIRIYILELKDLAKKDQFNESDPYIKILLGDEVKYDESKNYKENQKNCKWYKYYDVLSELPGESSLTIQVYDYDPLFKDELIGETTIDLEDRYFNQDWKEMKYKPIEIRDLRHPDFSNKQGSIYLWLEIFEKKSRVENEPWQIEPQPDILIEARFIVYETENMENLDIEDTSDIFTNVYILPENKQSTDTHYRCQNGSASFNWRMIFPIYYPKDKRVITIQVYDNDFFKRNDLICHGQLDLTDLMKMTAELDIPMTFNKEYVDTCDESHKNKYENVEFLSKVDDPDGTKFWLQLYKNNEKKGRIMCSCEFLPKWKAEVNKVGLGREEPNVSPYLPPPVGRFEFSLNPLKMINQCVGPKFRKKCYLTIIFVCLGVYIICMIPFVIYHVTGELVNPFNWLK